MAFKARKRGMTNLAKQMAKGRPLTPEQQKHQQEVNKMIQANQAQKKGMKDKMLAWKGLQEDKDRMINVPEQYKTSKGNMEQLAYVTPEEMQMLKQQGGSGEMTPYGIPSFNPNEDKADEGMGGKVGGDPTGGTFTANDYNANDSSTQGMWESAKRGFRDATQTQDSQGNWRWNKSSSQHQQPGENAEQYHQRMTGGGGGGGEGNPYGPPPRVKTPEEIEAERLAAAKTKWEEKRKADTEKHESGKLGRKRSKHVEGRMVDAEGRTEEDRGVMTDAEGNVEGDEGFNFETAEMKGGFDKSTAEMDTSDSFEGYKQQAKGLGAESKGITDQFGKDAENLAGYQSKFDKMAGDAKTRGDAGEKFQQAQGTKYENTAGKGAQALEGIAGEVKTAAQGGANAFGKGADAVSGVQDQFGKEGFQKDIKGMSEQALSTDLGQRDAAMLKGQMEEGRMASQKGSEEKLRREMAQSGASPAEIASKVAQFQKQSSADQAQASRSEALSSTMQGQQMGQARLGQAAQLKGQEAGMASQVASLGAQQAALRGQGAAMQMQGAGQRAGMQGQATGMQMQGIQGGAAMNAQGVAIGQAGANQQASMMGQGMGAVQAAGGARQQQMGGLNQQGQFIDQQGGYTQAQLNDVMAQQTQEYSEEQAGKTRQANASANSGGGGGGGGGFLSKLGISDIRLKDSIELLQEGMDGEPNIYSFKYKWDSKTTWSGVMAQELIGTKHADAVKVNPEGYYMVDYHKLGFPMVQLSVKE